MLCENCSKQYCDDRGNPKIIYCTAYTKKTMQTNADRIRAMSDEGLAVWIDEGIWSCEDCSEGERLSDQPFLKDEKCDKRCVEHCLEWLKQPAEG